jgi:hypothetical protein
MNDRWQYKVVDVKPEGSRWLSSGPSAEDMQAALDRLGAQGWELVHVVMPAPTSTPRLFLKRPG